MNKCELCNQEFDYPLEKICIELPPDGILDDMWACRECAEDNDVTDILEQELSKEQS